MVSTGCTLPVEERSICTQRAPTLPDQGKSPIVPDISTMKYTARVSSVIVKSSACAVFAASKRTGLISSRRPMRYLSRTSS